MAGNMSTVLVESRTFKFDLEAMDGEMPDLIPGAVVAVCIEPGTQHNQESDSDSLTFKVPMLAQIRIGGCNDRHASGRFFTGVIVGHEDEPFSGVFTESGGWTVVG